MRNVVKRSADSFGHSLAVSVRRVFTVGLFLLGVNVTAMNVTAAHSQVTTNAHGLTATSGGMTLEVSALRDDVLRVRESHTSKLPEDASWAVLAAARNARVAVIPEKDGFSTQSL